MNIVVAMKQIPDLQQIRIRNRQPVLDDVPMGFGNIDKNALEAGVILKEKLGEGKVVVVSVGNPEVEETIKEALAAGADEGFLVIDDEQATLESEPGSLLSWQRLSGRSKIQVLFCSVKAAGITTPARLGPGWLKY